MKGIVPLLLILIMTGKGLYAQITSPVRVKAGEDIYVKLGHEIYMYATFQPGVVTFRDGKMSQANLNYNLYNGEVQFISDKGDTLAVDNELTVKYLTIAKDSFFYNEGYVKLIAGNEAAKLVQKTRIKIIDQQKIGAYDQPTSAGAVTSYSSISNSLKNINLDIRQDVILSKQTSFLISDKYNSFQRATKKNLFKIFRKKEAVLNEYFKNNEVDFNKEEDLIKLLPLLKD